MKRFFVLFIAALTVLTVFNSCQKDDSAKLVYWSMWNEAEPQGQVIARAARAFTSEFLPIFLREIITTIQSAQSTILTDAGRR